MINVKHLDGKSLEQLLPARDPNFPTGKLANWIKF